MSVEPHKGNVPYKIYKVKACCGSTNTILESDKPIRKSHVKAFKEAKYFIPDNFFQAGIFYAQFGNLIVTSSYGSNRFSIRCTGGTKCDEQISAFEAVLEKVLNS